MAQFDGRNEGGLSIEDILQSEQLTDEQLDTVMEESDLPGLAACFDNIEECVEKLGLTLTEQNKVKQTNIRNGAQAGTKEALKCWMHRDPLKATFRDLLHILTKREIAVQVCKHLYDKVNGEAVRSKSSGLELEYNKRLGESVHAPADNQTQQPVLLRNDSNELRITNCLSNEDQDHKSKKPKTDSIQPIEEDNLAAAATENPTELSNEDEVKRKAEPPLPFTTDLDSADYYDILVIGRTGMGKSSTADKLMVPVDNWQTLSGSQPQLKTSPNNRAADPIIEEQDVQKIDVDKTGEIKYGNLRARILSVEAKDYETAQRRLQNIAYCRGRSNPHEKINKLRTSSDPQLEYENTLHCELLTNTDSKIRVLDTPGFFSSQLADGTTNTTDSNLATVRHILHIQAAENLKIKRIVYFLPQTGPLTRADRVLQEEIRPMVKFFNKSITNCMVLVGTMPEHATYCRDTSSGDEFPRDLLSRSGKHFTTAFRRELKERYNDTKEYPLPPTIFIAMTDTCEDVFKKISSAQVNDNNYQLEFNPRACSKCGIDLYPLKVKQGTTDWVKGYLEEDSYCHPLIQPMYSFNSMARGVLKLFEFKWKFTKERCVNCDKKIGSKDQRGCMKINTKFTLRSKWLKRNLGTVIVKHSSSVL